MKIRGPLETCLPRRTRHSFNGRMIQAPFPKSRDSSLAKPRLNGRSRGCMTNGAQRKPEVQHFTDTNNLHQFFSSIELVFGLSKSGSVTLLSADSTTLIKDRADINNIWRKHFSQLLNWPSLVEQSSLYQTSQKPTLEELDNPPSMNIVRNAIKEMECGKAAFKDGIPTEVYRALIEESLKAFHEVLASIWEEEEMPPDLPNATIISQYKNKNTKADCGNYRGISLLSVAGKIPSHIILNRLISTISEESLPDSQCGFQPDRNNIGMIFTVRQMQEKNLEQNVNL